MGILSPEAETFSYDGINLLDKKAKKKNARRLQKERQMIFQDSTSSLNQKMKVEKILAEPLEIHKVFSDKKEQHDFYVNDGRGRIAGRTASGTTTGIIRWTETESCNRKSICNEAEALDCR